MPRSLTEILDQADELAARFEDHEPADIKDAVRCRPCGPRSEKKLRATALRTSGTSLTRVLTPPLRSLLLPRRVGEIRVCSCDGA